MFPLPQKRKILLENNCTRKRSFNASVYCHNVRLELLIVLHFFYREKKELLYNIIVCEKEILEFLLAYFKAGNTKYSENDWY